MPNIDELSVLFYNGYLIGNIILTSDADYWSATKTGDGVWRQNAKNGWRDAIWALSANKRVRCIKR